MAVRIYLAIPRVYCYSLIQKVSQCFEPRADAEPVQYYQYSNLIAKLRDFNIAYTKL